MHCTLNEPFHPPKPFITEKPILEQSRILTPATFENMGALHISQDILGICSSHIESIVSNCIDNLCESTMRRMQYHGIAHHSKILYTSFSTNCVPSFFFP